jgi:hypothetical protein
MSEYTFDSMQLQQTFASKGRISTGAHQTRLQCIPGTFSPGLKILNHEGDLIHPSGSDIINAWHCTSIPPTRIHSAVIMQAGRHLYCTRVLNHHPITSDTTEKDKNICKIVGPPSPDNLYWHPFPTLSSTDRQYTTET